jgi:DnaJ-domain-containing protein 1
VKSSRLSSRHPSRSQHSHRVQDRDQTQENPISFQQLYQERQQNEEDRIRENDFRSFSQNHHSSTSRRLEDLEKMIQSEEVNRKSEQKRSLSQQDNRRFVYSLPRSVARPVERILTIVKKRNPLFSPNYYEILQLPFCLERNRKEIDLEFLGKRYRSLSRHIHPDHNPHPSAKEAFDLLHEAYSVLRSPVSREEYNREFMKFYSVVSPLRLFFSRKIRQKSIQKWKTRLSNLKSQLLLSYYQWRKGEKIEQLVQLMETFRMKSKELDDLFVHLSHLPTAFDRLEYMNEIIWDKKYQILLYLSQISLAATWLKRKNL